MTFLYLVILSAVTYRATRFIQLDTMFEDTRDRVVLWLATRRDEHEGVRGLLYRKAVDGATCAFCVSVWIAGAAVLAFAAVSTYDLGWVSIFDWLAVATGAMAIYRYIDPPE